MFSNSPVQRAHGVQETVIDKEVARAANLQGLAPAGAAPPLMVQALKPVNAKILVGASAPPGHHARTPTPSLVAKEYPEANQFARAEVARRLRVGGFYDTEFGKTQLSIVPPREPQIIGTHVPPGLNPIMHAPGAQM